MVKNSCNICGGKIRELFSFGNIYVSNFIPQDHKSEDYPKSDLTLHYCKRCRSCQLGDNINPDVLYKDKYWYYSGINSTMKNALKNIVDDICSKIFYKEDGDIWLDIACNDGTLLSSVPKEFKTIGVDPADKNIINLARQKADHVINDYFSEQRYIEEIGRKAKVITCIAMFYDLKNPVEFTNQVFNCLADDGIFVLQLSYTPLMLDQLEFGNICAEHVMYHSLLSMKNILNQSGFEIVDCELNDVNGGSIRIYATKYSQFYGNQQQRDVGRLRVLSLMSYENWEFQPSDFMDFYVNICNLKSKTVNFIHQANFEGKTVYAYGASTKGNMLLQYFGLDNKVIKKIADRNSEKWGLKTVGTEIPICSEEEMRKDNPDYLLVLPWYFGQEFKEREKDYLDNGGKFIFPCPKFSVEGYH